MNLILPKKKKVPDLQVIFKTEKCLHSHTFKLKVGSKLAL